MRNKQAGSANSPPNGWARLFAQLLWTTLWATILDAQQLFESKGLFARAQLCGANSFLIEV